MNYFPTSHVLHQTVPTLNAFAVFNKSDERSLQTVAERPYALALARRITS